MAFNPDNRDHVRLLGVLFQMAPVPSTVVGNPPPTPPTPSEIAYLDDIKTSSRVKAESVTHRKLIDVAEALGEDKRKELVAWLAEPARRSFIWNDFLVILHGAVDEIKVLKGPLTIKKP